MAPVVCYSACTSHEHRLSYWCIFQVRLGIAYFASSIETTVSLADGGSRDFIKDRMKDVSLTVSGLRNVSALFPYLTDQIFTGSNGDRPFVSDHVIILTDGPSQIQNSLLGLYKAKSRNMRLYTIGFSTGVNRAELSEIASLPNDYHEFYVVETNMTLRTSVFEHIIGLLCSPVRPTDFGKLLTSEALRFW